MCDSAHLQELNKLASIGYFEDAEEQPRELTIYEKLQLRMKKKEQKKEKKIKIFLKLLDILPEDLVRIIYKEHKYILETQKNRLKYNNVIERMKLKLEPNFFENWYFGDPECFRSVEELIPSLLEFIERHGKKYLHLPIRTKEDCYQILVDCEKRMAKKLSGWCWQYTECINVALGDDFRR
jgi:hypothetical protein